MGLRAARRRLPALTLALGVALGLAPGPVGGASPVSAAAAAPVGVRTPRSFDAKVRAMDAPLVEPSRPLPLRRAVVPKSRVATTPGSDHRSDRLVVKFAEGLRVRLRDGALTELAGRPLPGVEAALAAPGVAGVSRVFTRSEQTLDRDRAFAMQRAGVALADLNNYYLVHLATDADPTATAARWLGLDVVEIAYFEGLATDACTDIAPPTPDFQDSQNYLEPAPVGVDAFAAWTYHPAGAGVPGFWFIDVERGWNVDHEDFGEVAILNGLPYPSSINHGTAVLGEIVGCDGDFGVSGIASGVTARMVNWDNEPTIASAFDLAASYLDPGEVYLIEIHTPGPGPIPGWVCQCNCGQFGYVPMEWEQANFDAIQMHTAAGIIVVEAGGNGGMDLDDSWYGGAFDRTVRDSGALLVGAGAPGTHGPECWTNYGSRVDCQGYGSGIVSTGYGNLFDPGDENQWYTSSFSGTSGASPIVTGSAIVVQNLAQQVFGLTLDAITMRGALTLQGTPQGDPQEKHIGPLPDLGGTIHAWFRPVIAHTPLPDTQNEIDDYEVLATVTPALLNGGMQAVTVHYSVSGGVWESAPLAPTGNPDEWQGWIPAQAGGSYVLYYLEATPNAGPPELEPAAGELDPFLFVVGQMVPVVQDDLEAGPVGWMIGAPDDDATSGFWEHGDPYGTEVATIVVAPEDDHTPAPGVMAFVTGNPGPGAAASDGDVDDGKTTLFSPLFDLSGEIYARLSLWVWTRFLNDDVFAIDISNDGGATWWPLAALDTDLDVWHALSVELRREEIAYSDQMQLRFVASDYGVNTLVECGVDDLLITGLAQQSQAVDGDAATRTPAPPARLALGRAAPSPFRVAGRATTRVTYTLPHDGAVRLAVYDVAGRQVRTLVDGSRSAGRHLATWDGRRHGGAAVAPGIYFLRLEAAGEVRVGSVVTLH
jgi:hypothetical protein